MNRLSHEKSPYLRMHGENPVDWYPWGREAFDAARTLDRPILLSIGYSACHWCHVIARESFEDEGIAAQLNADFISVKVDREERPDIDAVYMDAVQLSTGSGGWPMTLLLLPDGRPFFAATYLPRDAMERVLAEAAALWQEDRAALVEDAGNLTAQMRAVASRDVPPCAPSPSVTARAIAAFSSAFDSQWGGFGSAPKFPSAPNLLFLLAHHAQTGDDRALSMATRTLDAMARGGIYDAIGGGFSRYSVDRQWLVPHFEKMLYDNALLLWAYARAWEITGKALYREVALRTADYVLRELTGPEGEFYCAQDADSEGAEGAFYTFTRAELFDLLGEADGWRFCDAYGITDAGNFEGVSIPNRIGQTEETADAAIDALRRRVYEYRRTRRTLHRDDKVLTSWNALMIVGLCESARILNQPEHLQAARRAERFLRTHLLSAKGEPLLRWRDGEARGDGVLSDYALYALALIELHEAAGDADLLPRAEALAQRMLDLFSDGSRGLFLYGSHGEPLITRPKDIWDAAIPSGNACAALVLKKLAAHTQDEHWRRAAESQLRFVAGAARESPLGCGFGLYAIAQGP